MPEPRTSHRIHHMPCPSDLATSWRGEVEVVATPVLLWLVEVCSMELLAERLEPMEMSLGYGHDSRHLAPALENTPLVVEARLEAIERPYAHFHVQATQGGRLILSGKHTRAVVDRGRFLGRLEAIKGLSAEV